MTTDFSAWSDEELDATIRQLPSDSPNARAARAEREHRDRRRAAKGHEAAGAHAEIAATAAARQATAAEISVPYLERQAAATERQAEAGYRAARWTKIAAVASFLTVAVAGIQTWIANREQAEAAEALRQAQRAQESVNAQAERLGQLEISVRAASQEMVGVLYRGVLDGVMEFGDPAVQRDAINKMLELVEPDPGKRADLKAKFESQIETRKPHAVQAIIAE